jgi:hypothetical protein
MVVSSMAHTAAAAAWVHSENEVVVGFNNATQELETRVTLLGVAKGLKVSNLEQGFPPVVPF